MRLRITSRSEQEVLFCGIEPRHLDKHAVLPQRNILEVKLSAFVADDGLGPLRRGRTQSNFRVLHRAVLWIVNQSVDGPENCGLRDGCKKKRDGKDRGQSQILPQGIL